MRPWSKSKMDAATGCALRFHLQYTEKAQGARVERGAGRIGRAAHQVLEAQLKGKKEPIRELLSAHGAEEELTSVETEELFCLEDQILEFMERFGSWMKRHGVAKQHLGIERRLAVKENFTKTRFWDNDNGMYRGVVDLMIRVPAGKMFDVVVLDHKTGKSTRIDYHTDQMKSYAVLAEANLRNVRSVRLALHFVQHGKITFMPEIGVEQIRDEYRPWLLNKVLETEELVANRTTNDPTEGWACDFCQYQHICPEKK